MKWLPFNKEITISHRIDGDPAGRRRRFLTWRWYRWAAGVLRNDDAVFVDVDRAAAKAGYRVGLRQGDDPVTLLGEDVLHEERFMVTLGPQPWLIFLVDGRGECIPAKQVSERVDMSVPKNVRLWII